MTSLDVFGLIAAYVALAVLLLSLHLYSTWNWWVKGGATLLLAAFYFVTYTSMPGLLGWPTPYEVPSRLYLIGVDVAEPDYVYLWARDLDRGLAQTTPRAYRVPYSRKLHRQAEDAGRKLRDSMPVIVEIDAAGTLTTDEAEGEALPTGKADIRFLDAPEGLIPPKD